MIFDFDPEIKQKNIIRTRNTKTSKPKANETYEDEAFMKLIPLSLRKTKITFQNLNMIESVYKNKLDKLELLLQDPTTDPNFLNGLSLIIATSFNNNSAIELLLSNEKTFIDPQSDGPIKSAIINGHIDIITHFLELYNPNKNSIYHMCSLAIQNSQYDILEKLCDIYPDLDLTIRNNYLIKTVFKVFLVTGPKSKHKEQKLSTNLITIKIVNFILNRHKINIADIKNKVLACAVENGHLDIVSTFISDLDIDISIPITQSLILAIQKSTESMIKLLLEDPRVNLSNYLIMETAVKYSRHNIIELLLRLSVLDAFHFF